MAATGEMHGRARRTLKVQTRTVFQEPVYGFLDAIYHWKYLGKFRERTNERKTSKLEVGSVESVGIREERREESANPRREPGAKKARRILYEEIKRQTNL